MRLGEVCLLTSDVVGLANFYRLLLGIVDDCEDDTHQFILSKETSLTIYNERTGAAQGGRRVWLAFTVEDVDAEYGRLTDLGVAVGEPPRLTPWGTRSMTLLDPDGNPVTLRSFTKEVEQQA